MDSPGPSAFLFSPANRPWTFAIILGSAALIAFLLLDGGGEGTTAGSTTTTTQATANDGSATSGAADASGGGATLGVAGGTLSADQCVRTAQSLSLAATGGLSPSGQVDPDRIDQAFDRMSDVAPGVIANDFSLIAAAFREFFSVLEAENVDLNDPTALAAPQAGAALQRAGAAIDSGEFRRAVDNVKTWFETACAEHIDS